MAITENQIEETLAFWQPRSSTQLTKEDARQIIEVSHDFVTLLTSWYKKNSVPLIENRQVG